MPKIDQNSRGTCFDWECCEAILNNGTYGVVDHGPLHGPVAHFSFRRDDELRLVFETVSAGNSASVHEERAAGTVYEAEDEVRIEGYSGAVAIASGVIPLQHSRKWDRDRNGETREESQCHQLRWESLNKKPAKYLIEWYENMPKNAGWPDLDTFNEVTSTTRVLQGKRGDIIQTAADETGSSARSCVHLRIHGLDIVIGTSRAQPNFIRRPGYILYIGAPDDELRRKIRDRLSFCLGSYLIYLGWTSFDDAWRPVAFSASSGHALVKEADRLQGWLPAPLGLKFIPELTEERLTKQLATLLNLYDAYHLRTVFWNYWHSLAAPVHMAAAHLGATIEGLQKSWYGRATTKLDSRLVTNNKDWQQLRENLSACIQEANLPEEIKELLDRKINGLNTAPQNVLMERFLSGLDLQTTELEKSAWRNRNRAAHGAGTSSQDPIRLIRENKLLTVLLHRIILALAGGDHYFDYYSHGRPMRQLRDAPND
ncbi:hypothetical protein D9X30_1604 (plasmid) [Cupriavidus sp. U2]|nr:hypothetical protein D9X30_1604 [Cupriavidus sp. U2]